MDTLGRSVFVSLLEREYDLYFDGLHALVYLHVDRLKYYNRLRDVEAGDKVLHAIIDWIGSLATHGLVARYAGDGLTFVTPTEEVASIPDAVNAMLPTFGDVNGLEAKLGAIVCESPMSVDDAMKRALFACGSIDDKAGEHLCMFEGRVRQQYDRRSYIVDHLDDAIAAGEIQAWGQPIVRVLTGKVCEVEVLARWQSKHYGFLFPDEFVPVLEQYQLIHKLDLEVIRLACAQWSEMRAMGTNVPFGINLSRLDFELCDIYASIRSLMRRYDVPVDQVHIEVTESMAVRDDDLMTEGVRRFRESGFAVYMDDFGSGYSSLGQMADMHFDVVKFDKGMVDHVTHNERARAVLADSISMVKRLGMQTLCEGVENVQQLAFLRAVGCEKAQGYYFSKPMSYERIAAFLQAQADENNSEVRAFSSYMDAIGQVNLLEGTSAALHGVEAAAFLGRFPVAVLELRGDELELLECNFAFDDLIDRLGSESFAMLATAPTKTNQRIAARAMRAARLSRKTGQTQHFDFIVSGVFCSATMDFIAEADGREAYLNTITSVENAPQVTEHTLLTGVLETSDLCFFWKDVERRFLGANQRFLDYYGFESVDDIVGKTDEDMGWHEKNEPFHNDEVQVLEGHEVTDACGVCMRQGELRDIIATKRPLYSHGAIVGLVGIFEDIGPHVG